jgi:adenine/guanine/hypoxanthine permease
MLAPIRKIDFDDYTELLPAFAVIALMSFTYNVGVGIAAGFVLYPWFKVAARRGSEVRPGLWMLNILSTMLFAFYPY